MPFEYLHEDSLNEEEELFEVDTEDVLQYIGPDGADVYVIAELFAVGILGEHEIERVYVSEVVTFELSENLVVMTPYGEAWDEIEIDLGDGSGFRSLDIGSTLSTSYLTTGERTLTVKAHFNGVSREAGSTILVVAVRIGTETNTGTVSFTVSH